MRIISVEDAMIQQLDI
eukprot:gene18003-23641_t